jgi:hypothetical protein
MERPRWKLVVEGLGKIERAEVDVHPLMLFVGDNNSGKSYLASVLWGLLAMQRALPLPAGPTLAACEAWLEARRAELDRVPEYLLSPADHALFTTLFNELICHDDVFIKQVFNSPVTAAARIAVTPLRHHDLRVAWELVDRADSGTVVYLREAMLVDPRLGESYRAYLLKYIASWVTLGWTPPLGARSPTLEKDEPIFLPASRSGFMLTYKDVTQRVFQGESQIELTQPTKQFINLLAFGVTSSAGRYAAEADLLEGGLDGRIELVSGAVGINDYTYHPTGSANLRLPLTSSLVTELAPIVLVLRHMSGFPILVLEEPEAHLHPKLQRRLAQVIVRLVRKGLYVWITTHSENFCQQINDFMKIGAVPDRAKLAADMQKALGYSYDEQDYLTPDDVAGYEFVNQGEHSVVRELSKHPDGLVMPTFNREMMAIDREVTFLEQQLDEET